MTSATSRAGRDKIADAYAGGALFAEDALRDRFFGVGLNGSRSSGPSTLWISFGDTVV